MDRMKRRLRNTQHCHQIDNTFNFKNGNREIIRLIPISIVGQVNSTKLISCHRVAELPQFKTHLPIDDELTCMSIASAYQQRWANMLEIKTERQQNQIMQEMQERDREPSINGRTPAQEGSMQIEQKLPLWENMAYLQKLNSFIMGEEVGGKYAPSTESFFDK